MHESFPSLYFLGNLSDVAVYNQLRESTFFAAFFDRGVRANNTSVAAAMETGAVVITNLDELSPPEYVHMRERDRHRALRRAAHRPGGARRDPGAGGRDGGETRVGRAGGADGGMSERGERIAAVGYDYAAHETEPVDACNLCGATDLVELSRRDRYGYRASLRMCRRCGLGFLSPRLTAAGYGAFYEDVYRPLVSAFHGRRIDAETVQDDQRGYAAELVELLRASLPSAPESVMDVGGSTGIVSAAVREAFGSEATVLDPAPAELEVAAAAGMETIAGFAEDYDPGERRWDLVLLCQTIDHLLDVRGTLESMRRIFDPVALLPSVPHWFVARKDLPPKDLKELIAYLQGQRGGKVTSGSVGAAGSSAICSYYSRQDYWHALRRWCLIAAARRRCRISLPATST